MADVTAEQAQWSPPGRANPLGATYAHAVLAEDMLVNGLLKGGPPLMATSFAGKTGLSEPPPPPDQDFGDWARRVQVDLAELREYGQAVYRNTGDCISSLTEDDLERTIDLTNMGLGKAQQYRHFIVYLIPDSGKEGIRIRACHAGDVF